MRRHRVWVCVSLAGLCPKHARTREFAPNSAPRLPWQTRQYEVYQPAVQRLSTKGPGQNHKFIRGLWASWVWRKLPAAGAIHSDSFGRSRAPDGTAKHPSRFCPSPHTRISAQKKLNVDRPGASLSHSVHTDRRIFVCHPLAARVPIHFSKSYFSFHLTFHRTQLSECLEAALAHACPVDATEALETLSIYMDNIIQMPLEKKFRAIRISNVNFQERIGHLNGSCACCVSRWSRAAAAWHVHSSSHCLFCCANQVTFSRRLVSRRTAIFSNSTRTCT